MSPFRTRTGVVSGRRPRPARRPPSAVLAAACLLPLVSAPPAGAQQSAAAEAPAAADVAREVDRLANRYHDLRLFNGTVLVARGDDVLFEKGYGDADMEWDVPNEPDVRFRIGSVTKQFTAALVLKLAEEGLIDLQAPVSTYLPDYPKPQGDEVTVHHLLTHTSGIPSYTGFPDFWEQDSRDPFTPDSMVATFSGMELEFEPGAQWNYNNSGYFLLGYLVEKVTGEPYDRALRTRLLEPLGLDDTGYDHFAELLEGRAEGYVRTPAGYENAAYLDTSIPYAAGSMYSTVRDLHAWTRALHGGEVFADPSSFEKMTTPDLQNYAYGLFIGKEDPGTGADSVRTIGHGGGINGFVSQLQYYPDSEHTVVVLDNTSSGTVGALADGIGALLHGGEPEEPKPFVGDVVYETIEAEGVEAGLARYRELKESAPEEYDFSESQLNRVGYIYLERGDIQTAIAVFEANTEAFPKAYNTWDSLAEAHMEAGHREEAIAHYQKSLELYPGNDNAREKLAELGVDAEVETVELSPEVLERYVSAWEVDIGPGFEIPIRREGSALEARIPGAGWRELIPQSETRFMLDGAPFQFVFEVEGEEVTGMTLITPDGEEVPGRRVEASP